MALEIALLGLVREMGRLLLQSVLNACEPEQPHELPKDLWFQCDGYRRRNQKTANRHVASRFGDIVLMRRGYRSWQPGDGSQPPRVNASRRIWRSDENSFETAEMKMRGFILLLGNAAKPAPPSVMSTTKITGDAGDSKLLHVTKKRSMTEMLKHPHWQIARACERSASRRHSD